MEVLPRVHVLVRKQSAVRVKKVENECVLFVFSVVPLVSRTIFDIGFTRKGGIERKMTTNKNSNRRFFGGLCARLCCLGPPCSDFRFVSGVDVKKTSCW